MGGLVNAAAENRDVRRVEDIWCQLTKEFHVQPNLIAYAARAKAHLLCGHPAATVDVVDEMMRAHIEPNSVVAMLLAQASLILYHSSLAADGLLRLQGALEDGLLCRRKSQEIRSLMCKIQSNPRDVALSHVLVGWNLRRSAMSSCPDHRSGTNYLEFK